jgi:Ala-tRNA(Pro) deacylase
MKEFYMTTSTLLEIRGVLQREGIQYEEIEHLPTHTSEESARARGENLRIGGKAIILKLGDADFRIFVLSAALSIDSSAIRKELGAKKIKFADPEAIFSITTLVRGSIPPFGPPILPFPLYADPSILENDRIAFNAGSLTNSIIISVKDWLQIAKPIVLRFAKNV